MKTFKTIAFGISALGLALVTLGCQSQPTTPPPTPTDEVIVVVVTATTQPTIEATQPSEPTITPLATFTPIGTIVASSTTGTTATATRKAATVAPSTPKPVRTNAPAPTAAGQNAAQTTAAQTVATKTAAAPAPAPSTIKYPAPNPISPGTRDSVTDGSDMQIYYGSVGPLGTNECYLLHVWMTNPNASSGAWGEYFLDKNRCGDQSPPNTRLKFVVNRPKFGWPDYGAMERAAQQAADTDLLRGHWNVLVVQNNGVQPDGVHYNTVPLSPTSATLDFDFKP